MYILKYDIFEFKFEFKFKLKFVVIQYIVGLNNITQLLHILGLNSRNNVLYHC